MNQLEQDREVRSLIKAALLNGTPYAGDLFKAFTQSSSATAGLTAYDLEAPALRLFPVLTPLRNKIPRVTGKGGIQANWKAITGININGMSPGIGQGQRGGIPATAEVDYFAAFRGLGMDDTVTFEAQYAGEGFDDIRAMATDNLLRATMIGEEKVILGGNTSLPLGTTPTPTLSDVSGAGTLAANTAFSVICVALSHEGYLTGSVANGINAAVSRTNADNSTASYGGGAARKSTNTTITTANDGAGHTIRASVAAAAGAFGYAWFWGAAGSEVLGAITTINSVAITAAATGTQTAASLPASDNSTNGLVFDGILTQVLKNGAGYYAVQPTGTAGVGTPLTANNAGGVVEIDTALKWFWDNYRLSPDTIWVAAQEQKNIRVKILTTGTGAADRFVFTTSQGSVVGGSKAVSYLNPFTMDGAVEIPIKIHPNLPPGTIMFTTDRLPYPLANVASVLRILCRRDYHQIDWPMITRMFQMGVYVDEVLQCYAAFAFGLITNIADG